LISSVAFLFIDAVQRSSHPGLSVAEEHLLVAVPHVPKRKTTTFLVSARAVSVNHQVNIEVEERVEGEEVSDRGVVSVETSDKVVLEDAEAKLGVDDRSCQQDYHSHEADDELQPGLDKLHCSQLSKGLGCQVEYVDDISGQQNKKRELETCGSEQSQVAS